jgi:hypothetical protein
MIVALPLPYTLTKCRYSRLALQYHQWLKNPELLDPTRAASSHLYRAAVIYLPQVVLPSQLSRAGQKQS